MEDKILNLLEKMHAEMRKTFKSFNMSFNALDRSFDRMESNFVDISDKLDDLQKLDKEHLNSLNELLLRIKNVG